MDCQKRVFIWDSIEFYQRGISYKTGKFTKIGRCNLGCHIANKKINLKIFK